MSPKANPGDYAAVNPSMPLVRGKGCVIEFNNGEAIYKVFDSKDDKTVTVIQYNPPQTLKFNMKEIRNIYRVSAIED